MTLQEWVYECRDAMNHAELWFGHGTDNAEDEAAWLVLAAIKAPVDGSFSGWGLSASRKQETSISGLLKLRIQSRKPLAYLLGEAWFYGLKFFVNDKVLVPRSPIAELIRNQFSPWIRSGRVKRVLDLCTGSACIAIATALEMSWVRVDAVDLSSKALQVAAKNVEMHGVGDRVELIESDLFEGLAGRSYELVVSNPPYVSRAEFDSLPAEYHAEPEMALMTGMKGLEIPLEILNQSTDFLTPDGVLICEVGENAELLQSVLPDLPLTWLEFGYGGSGVFAIGRDSMAKHRGQVIAVMEKLRNVA